MKKVMDYKLRGESVKLMALLILFTFHSSFFTLSFAQFGFFFGPQTIKLWPDGNPEKEYVARPNDYQKNLIERYVDSGDPYDKAGAYGIQNGGALLVKKVDGDYFNVVGLPASRLYQELKLFHNMILKI
mgnify:CR=1 FL=1